MRKFLIISLVLFMGCSVTDKFHVPYVNYDDNLDLSNAKAAFNDGLLTVRVPQRPEVKPVSIDIQ